MINQIDANIDYMPKVNSEYAKKFKNALIDRIKVTRQNKFSWGIFAFTKPFRINNMVGDCLRRKNIHELEVIDLDKNPERLSDYGYFVDNSDILSIELGKERWKSNAPHRPVVGGFGKDTEGVMTVKWVENSCYAWNESINRTFKDLAFKDDDSVYCHWFNRHESGEQLFCVRSPQQPVYFIVAPAHQKANKKNPLLNDPKPEDFVVLRTTCQKNLVIYPNVWHTNPIAKNDLNILTIQSSLDATSEIMLSEEANTFLSFKW
jgi:hypothetical protein